MRVLLGHSQGYLADALGISVRAYQNYERGERAVTDTLIRACYSTFGIDPVWLLTGEGDMFRSRGTGATASPPAEVELSREEAAILALYRELDGDAQREIQNVATEKKRLREVERQLKDLQADLAARRRSA